MHTRWFLTLAVVVALPLAGCVSNPARVSASQMRSIQQAMPRLQVGMSKDEALAALPPHGYRNMIGATSVEGGTLEEWAIEAFVVDTWGTGQVVQTMSRYLYFVNNKLADVSVAPLQYRDRRDLVVEWRNR